MKKTEKEPKLAVFCSTVYLAVSIGIFVIACGLFWPQIGEKIRAAVTGWDGNPIKAAFYTFADGLEQGQPVREVFSQTIEEILP